MHVLLRLLLHVHRLLMLLRWLLLYEHLTTLRAHHKLCLLARLLTRLLAWLGVGACTRER